MARYPKKVSPKQNMVSSTKEEGDSQFLSELLSEGAVYCSRWQPY